MRGPVKMLCRRCGNGRSPFLRLIVLLAVLTPAADGLAKPRAPRWLVDAAGRVEEPVLPGTTADKNPPVATVLVDEAFMKFRPDGRHVVTRFALRIHHASARGRAVARTTYIADGRRKPKVTAWLISPSGEVKKYGRRDQVDRALARISITTEARMISIVAAQDVQPGAVFGWEVEEDEQSPFLQVPWKFQQDIPVARSALTIDVPPGWKAHSITFNYAPIIPRQNGTRYTWELTNLAAVRSEPHGPSLGGLATSIGVEVMPGDAQASSAHNGGSTWSWEALARYFSGIYAEQANPTPEVIARARELASNSSTAWEKAQRIGAFVQEMNYVSIALNLSHGGGYTPRPASETIRVGYGDCKDKATAMRSLLGAVGIPAYPVLTCSTDRRGVRAEWPSPLQFNHCIIAIAVDDAVESPAIIDHERLGRLLVFDPTNPFMPLGSLSSDHQGANGLLIDEEGGLVQLPFDTPADNRVDRKVTSEIFPNGAIIAIVEERYVGASAARQRSQRRRLKPQDYHKALIGRLTPTLGAVRLGDVSAGESEDGVRLDLRFEALARSYAKAMRDRLLVFKPVIMARRLPLDLGPGERTQPILIEPEAYVESTRILIPVGFDAAELPEPVTLSGPWGEYSSACRMDGADVVHERTLTLRAAEVPAAEHERVRTFFQRLYEAEQLPVVLERATPGDTGITSPADPDAAGT